MRANVRTFEPVGPYVKGTTIPRSVRRWIWKRGKGLFVEWKNGTVSKSEYTLRQLTEGRGWREGGIVETTE